MNYNIHPYHDSGGVFDGTKEITFQVHELLTMYPFSTDYTRMKLKQKLHKFFEEEKKRRR